MLKLEERIKAKIEEVIPIIYLDTPTQKADCRIKRQRKEILRTLRAKQMHTEIFDLIAANAKAAPGVITAKVNEYFDNYLKNHPFAENDNF